MPHSVSPQTSPQASLDEDVLPDAPALDLHVIENTVDVKIDDLDLKSGTKDEVRLEDLFHDDDDEEDEEFPSSSATHDPVDSSPPAAPL